MLESFIRPEYPLSEVTAKIIKAAKIVHQELGPDFEEVTYQRALVLELYTDLISPAGFGLIFSTGVKKLAATCSTVALLLNFGTKQVEIKRLINETASKK